MLWIWLDKQDTIERRLDTELLKQEFSHFIIDQLLLGYETVVMSIGDHDNVCMRKSVLKFGD